MTFQEIVKLAGVISAFYPNFRIADKELWVNAWYLVFKVYDASVVNRALGLYVTKNTTWFPPTPGQIIEYIPKEEVSEQQVWAVIRNAVENGNYNASEEFNKLSPELQKAVGSPQTIKEWAQTDSETLESVIQSQFLRSFREVKKNAESQGKQILLTVTNQGRIEGS